MEENIDKIPLKLQELLEEHFGKKKRQDWQGCRSPTITGPGLKSLKYFKQMGWGRVQGLNRDCG